MKLLGDKSGRGWKYEYYASGSGFGPEGNLKSIRTPRVTATHNKFLSGKERHYDYQAGNRFAIFHNRPQKFE